MQGETRRSLFARLREEVETLHMFGLGHDVIADVLEITLQDVRALCPTTRQKTITPVLSRRALVALLNGPHAPSGGNTLAERTQRLAEIASAYTQGEFATEPGVGAVTVMEVSLWLRERGLSFRPAENPAPLAEETVPSSDDSAHAPQGSWRPTRGLRRRSRRTEVS
ncbi:hypothetical protein [Azorhizobium oxalatiphilum]|nr:hypothetical protein [Azorhizobium oxalatiphilum]